MSYNPCKMSYNPYDISLNQTQAAEDGSSSGSSGWGGHAPSYPGKDYYFCTFGTT